MLLTFFMQRLPAPQKNINGPRKKKITQADFLPIEDPLSGAAMFAPSPDLSSAIKVPFVRPSKIVYSSPANNII